MMQPDSPFSYECHRCRRCCCQYHIQVNPYELIHIAMHLGVTTTDVLRHYVDEDRPWLKRKRDGRCIFLGQDGCTIHPHRPLVCRAYPLGIKRDESGKRIFIRLGLPERSRGEFGVSGTVREFLGAQGCSPFLEAGNICLRLHRRIVAGLESGTETVLPAGFGDHPLDWLDVDKVIALADKTEAAVSPMEKLNEYVAVLDLWLGTANLPDTQQEA